MSKPAGYSGTPLVKKLGIKSAQSICIVDPPAGYGDTLGPLPEGVTVLRQPDERMAFIHFFTASRASLEGAFDKLKGSLDSGGMLWISWPKKSSGVASDLDENQVRDIGLRHGLVDVKVCAVDETWSGLKFVFRLSDR